MEKEGSTNDPKEEWHYGRSLADDDLKTDIEREANLFSSSRGGNNNHLQLSYKGLSDEESHQDSNSWRETYTRHPDYGSATSMAPELYKSTITGDINAFKRATEDTESSPFDQASPRGNTVLHLAASLGHDKLVELILQQCPDLLNRENYKGDIALHVAASGGHLSTVKCLIHHASNRLMGSTSRNGDLGELKRVNNEGNTALHVALENGHQEVAEFLVEADFSTVMYYWNREEKSPLCMAAQAGYLKLVKLMMVKKPVGSDNYPNMKSKGKSVNPFDEQFTYNFVPNQNLKGKSPLHAAIEGRNRDVLDTIWKLSNNPTTLIKTFDEEGRTPLSFAAYIGYIDGVRYLLDKSTDATYQRDQNGFFPIHMASSVGDIDIVQEFLRRCPDSRELLDRHGQNILHVAAKFGRAKLVSYMLKTQELEMLINERDNRGNTPLHVATMHWHPKVVSIFTWDERVRLELVNNIGMTAMDDAAMLVETMAPFRKRLTLTALKSANAPRSKREITKQESFSPLQLPNKEQYKERVNTLLLVSTLVATVTFAAGFTVPGGYISSGSQDQGMVILATKSKFQAFFICNTIAMYSSVIVDIALIFAQLGDLNLILIALKFALPLLGVALTMMSLAFMAGVFLIVSNLNWLAYVVLIIGLIFLVFLFALFIPLYSPISSNNYIARYLFYYPFCFMIWATRSDVDHKKE